MAKKKSVEKSNPECRRSLTDRSELQKFVLHLLQGAMIGIGAVLPGISGGVLSVVFGIYEPIMAFLSNPREALSQYGRLLLPVLLGAAGGFLLSARAIGFFLTRYEVLSVCLFVGLIVGMLPSMFREAGEKGRSRWDLYALAGAFFTVLILLSLVRRISVSIPQGLFGNLFCGFCVALSIIVPGMSFSALLMPLGLYTPFMEEVGAVYLPAVVPAVLSAGVTMVLLAKQITRLLERHYSVVFHGIIGIVLAATLVIVPFSAFGNPETSAVSLICLAAGAGTALLFSMLGEM